jgi:hypothetical protein
MEAEAGVTPASLPAHQAPPRRLSGTFFSEFSAPSRAPAVRVPGDFAFVTIQDHTTVTGPCLECRFPALTRLWETTAFMGTDLLRHSHQPKRHGESGSAVIGVNSSVP